jgi:mono/diheme cytochrome c family protein
MQFIASKENGPEKFRKWEDDFRHVEAYIDSLQPPQFPYEIDKQLAAAGERVFTENCAVCHGSYREEASYPELIVPLDEIGTDPVRLRSLTVEHRENYGRNWINEYGSAGEVIADPGGYLAPPLDGVWASAPYLHNGSVPTLWHLLHPELRPAVWRVRDHDAYDRQRIGLVVDEFNEMPTVTLSGAERRRYFQTSTFGKSAAGHDFPAQLTVTQRTSVLEYLKTL